MSDCGAVEKRDNVRDVPSVGGVRDVLVKFFYTVLGIFPFLIAFALGLLFIFGAVDWEHFLVPKLTMRAPMFFVAAGFFVIALVALVIGRRTNRSLSFRTFLFVTAGIVILALLLRITYIVVEGSGVQPYSDYLWSYETALGSTERYYHYALYPSWGFYARVLGVFLQCAGPSYVAIQYANAVMEAAVAGLLVLISWQATKRSDVAIMAGIVYAVAPSSIAYVQMLSPEIPALLLDLVAVSLIAAGVSARKLPVQVLSFAAAGVLLGVAEMLKPIGPIFLIALALSFVFFYKKQNGMGEEMTHERAVSSATTKRLVALAGSFLILVVCFFGTKAGIINYLSNSYDEPINTSSAPHFLYVGLAPDGEGQIHLGKGKGWDRAVYESYEYDFDAAGKEVLTKVKQNVSENLGNLPRLLAQKARWAWHDDCAPFGYAQRYMEITPLRTALASLSQWFYLGVMFFAAVGSFALARRGSVTGWQVFFMLAVVFGFALLLLIGEAQARYKVMVMPFVYLAVSFGLCFFADQVKGRFV